MRYKQKFYYWCREAVCKIAYVPDMNKVYNELFEHLLDRHAYFVAKGMDEDTAADKTLEAMGDPKVIAPQLAAIHRPGWAYAMVVTRVIAVFLLLLITTVSLVKFINHQAYIRNVCQLCDIDPFTVQQEDQIFSVEPDVKRRSDGYTFTIEKVAMWSDRIVIRMKATTIYPWARTPTVPLYMWAEDSAGTHYISHAQSTQRLVNTVIVQMEQHSLTTHYYDLYIYGETEGIQWLKLCYNRDGRNILFQIDLTEG